VQRLDQEVRDVQWIAECIHQEGSKSWMEVIEISFCGEFGTFVTVNVIIESLGEMAENDETSRRAVEL
jgi:hypothetical protein